MLNTYEAQLGRQKEDSAATDRWNRGSEMTDTYDRARCTTELRLRQSVLDNIAKVRNPVPDFQIPVKPRGRPLDPNGDGSSSAPDKSSGSDKSTVSTRCLERLGAGDNSTSGSVGPV